MIFPTNFLWGASTSAFQVEGGYNEGGKGVATTDLGARRPGIADNKVAADHYHHWKEDVDLMAELGLKVYRMGFAWSRIMPDATCHPQPEGWPFTTGSSTICWKKESNRSLLSITSSVRRRWWTPSAAGSTAR